jgi:hypothetical protein
MPVVALVQGSPFDTDFNTIQGLFAGTIAKVASLVAIVIGAYGFARGEPVAKKALAGVAAGTTPVAAIHGHHGLIGLLYRMLSTFATVAFSPLYGAVRAHAVRGKYTKPTLRRTFESQKPKQLWRARRARAGKARQGGGT